MNVKKIKIVALMLAVVILLAGCGTSSEGTEAKVESFQTGNVPEETDSKVLIVYFSRIGNIDSEHEIDAVSSASVVTQGDNLLGNMEYMTKLIGQETIWRYSFY